MAVQRAAEPRSPAPPRGRRLRAWLAGLAVFLVVGLLCAWVVDALAARADLEPAGPVCTWEADPGSGPSGTGTERTSWFPWPTRQCVTPAGEVWSGGHVDSSSPLQPDLLDRDGLLWWAAAWLGTLLLATAAGAATVVARLRRTRPT